MTIIYNGVERYEELAKAIHKTKGPTGDAGMSIAGQQTLTVCSGVASIGPMVRAMACGYTFYDYEFSDDFVEIELIVTNNWNSSNAEIEVNGAVVGSYSNTGNLYTSQRAILCKFGDYVRATTDTTSTITYINWAYSNAIAVLITNVAAGITQVPFIVRISRTWL